MRIAIASGKGGAGKTSVTASLVRVWDGPRIAADCDAEAPNLHLFLNPLFRNREVCFLRVPARIAANCSQCGRCRDMCRYGAIARFGKKSCSSRRCATAAAAVLRSARKALSRKAGASSAFSPLA